MKIGEVKTMVYNAMDALVRDDEDWAIYPDDEDGRREADEHRRICDRWWPHEAPHRVARVRLVEVDESGKETA